MPFSGDYKETPEEIEEQKKGPGISGTLIFIVLLIATICWFGLPGISYHFFEMVLSALRGG